MPNYSTAHYYGQIVNPASRTALADALKVELVAAGWSVASGSSGDWKLDSAITPDGLQCRARVYDPGSGNCARVYLSDVAEVYKLDTYPIFLLPNAAETWEVYANPYFCTLQVIPWPALGRKIGMFGTGFVPPFFVDGSYSGGANDAVNSMFQAGNGINDSDTTNRGGFWNASYCTYQGSLWNALKINTDTDASGVPQAVIQTLPRINHPVKYGVDESGAVCDFQVGWSPTSHTGTTDVSVRLMPYDMILYSTGTATPFSAGDEISIDGKTWRVISHSMANSLCVVKSEP